MHGWLAMLTYRQGSRYSLILDVTTLPACWSDKLILKILTSSAMTESACHHGTFLQSYLRHQKLSQIFAHPWNANLSILKLSRPLLIQWSLCLGPIYQGGGWGMVQVTQAAGAPTFQSGDFSTLSQLIACCHIFISGPHSCHLKCIVCTAICAQAADTLKYGAGLWVFFLNHFFLEKKSLGGGTAYISACRSEIKR